jgi:replicative DNA helicase
MILGRGLCLLPFFDQQTKQEMIPQNTEAEECLLSSFVTAGGASKFDEVATMLEASDFYKVENQIIFKCMRQIVVSGNELDEISLSEELKKDGMLDEIGGIAGMMEHVNKTGMVQVKMCAEIIKEKSNLRQLIKQFRSSVEEMQSEVKDSKEVSSEIESLLLGLNDMSDCDKSVKSALAEIQEEFESMLDGSYEADVVKTHIDHLDIKLHDGGIGMGEVCVIAAPTSCGKSQLALNIASRAVDRQGISAFIFSFEMPQKQVLKRMMHSMSGVNPRNIKAGLITEDEREKVRQSSKAVEGMNIFTSHSVRNVEDLMIQARSMVRKHGIKLIIIDYLQLVPWDANKFGKTAGVSDISHKVKQMAIELNIAVILLSQVNRDGARSEGGLEVYHLRDSGDIENDADVIIMMYPEHMDMNKASYKDNVGEYKNMVYKIGKNREGERDLMGNFKFYNQYGRFY